jgi:hypothetical protein
MHKAGRMHAGRKACIVREDKMVVQDHILTPTVLSLNCMTTVHETFTALRHMYCLNKLMETSKQNLAQPLTKLNYHA